MNVETALILAFVFGGEPSPPAVKATVPIATRTVLDHGYFTGHTHVCPNPNCSFRRTYGEPYVWSHAMQPGHNCPHCGAAQYVQSNRPTTILRTIPVQSAAPRPAAPLATLQRSALAYQGCPPSG